MQGKRGRTTKRAFHRVFPYLLMLLAVAVLVAALVLVIRQIRSMEQTETPQQEVTESEQTAEEEPATQPQAEQAQEIAPEKASKTMASGQLTVYYDDSVLDCSKKDGVVSLTYRDGAHTARLDIQELSSRLDFLKDDEQDRLAIGLLQAYYYAAPPTEQITLSERSAADGTYSCILSAPAYEDVEAMTAYVRMDQIDGSLWYTIALLPETETADAIVAAFRDITVQ